ncbi:MAG: MFS transporter, partial [Thermoguttaceae bacterium]
ATALSFLDRQVLSVLAPVITEQLKMSNTEYSYVTTAFLVSYAVMFLLGGRMIDVLGTRLGMALSVGFWSVASAAHAVVQNAVQLASFRFLLGMGEGGCFPGAAKGVAEWFPQRQRALAMGVAIGGSALGAVVAPPLTVWLARALGWRGVFVVTGLIGAGWVALWWLLSARVETLHEQSAEPETQKSDTEQVPFVALLARADTWGLALMRFIVDPVFYFYMFWIPKYLSQERGVSLEQIGQVTWIPFLALGVSNIAGGWVSDRMIRSGLPALTARRWIMAAAAALTLSSSLAGRTETLAMAIAMMSLLMLAHGFWITNYVTVISERFPKSAVGTVMGFTGAIGAVGGMLANTAIGRCVDRFSYGPVWMLSGFMYPLAFVVLMTTVRSATRGGQDAERTIDQDVKEDV